MSRSLMVDDETYGFIRQIIQSETLINQNGSPVKKNAEVVRMLVVKYLRVRVASDAELETIQAYGLSTIAQYDEYHNQLSRLPRINRTPDNRKLLIQAVVNGTADTCVNQILHQIELESI